jgi:hypothetical protein
MVVDRYKGYSVYRMREDNYKVQDGKERYHVYNEGTGQLAFAFIAFYNPKRILRPENKEAVIAELMKPALDAMRAKLDAGDLSDGFLHVESAPGAPHAS